jgi:hypothetical protein
MGNWSIVIHGTGSHNNTNNPEDANRMTAKFVDDLKAKGHSVQSALFTTGGTEDLRVEAAGYKRWKFPQHDGPPRPEPQPGS